MSCATHSPQRGLDWDTSYLGLYSSAIFCSWYRQLIIVMLVIISVTVEQCDRNSQVPYVEPYKFMTDVLVLLEHNACMRPQSEPLLPLSVFKTQDKMIWWGCFLVDFSYVNLLKLEKDVEDDIHYSVLQINVVSNRKYCY